MKRVLSYKDEFEKDFNDAAVNPRTLVRWKRRAVEGNLNKYHKWIPRFELPKLSIPNNIFLIK